MTRPTQRGTAPGEHDTRTDNADADAAHSDADATTQPSHDGADDDHSADASATRRRC